MCFNPHTHAGCDLFCYTWFIRYDVSIHTPTQGVTPVNPVLRNRLTVSIHTPTQGVTPSALCRSDSLHCFNPHTHAGCDRCILVVKSVSHLYFAFENPTQGVTGAYWLLMLNRSSFNPHTHAGCDFGVIQARQEAVVSIHTPTQGVTPLLWSLCQRRMFQSTHPRRVWPTPILR